MKNLVNIMQEKTEYSEQKQKFRERKKKKINVFQPESHFTHDTKKHQNIQETKKMHKTEIFAGKNVHKLFI
jgi:hypothetical protein